MPLQNRERSASFLLFFWSHTRKLYLFVVKDNKKALARRPRAEQERFSGRMLLYTAVMAIKTHGVISSVGLLLNLPITPPLRCAWFRLEVCSRRSSPVNSLGRTDPAEHERMLSHHIVDVNNMILLRQAFSHLSSVST